MGLLQTVIKFYLIVLLFRTVMTRQELYFNPLGKLVAKMTDPVLEKAFKLTKKRVLTICCRCFFWRLLHWRLWLSLC